MSAETFPTLAGVQINVRRAAKWSTKVQAAASGKELRTSWRSRAIYEFQVTFEFLRQGGGRTEAATLADFYNRMRGAWDTFYFVDPIDGTTRTCRFADDHLELEKFSSRHWKTSGVKLVEVI